MDNTVRQPLHEQARTICNLLRSKLLDIWQEKQVDHQGISRVLAAQSQGKALCYYDDGEYRVWISVRVEKRDSRLEQSDFTGRIG